MDKQIRKYSLAMIALGCVLSLATRTAAAEGAGTFACHVATDSGQPGVFFVQTDNKDEAGEAALRARVTTVERVKAQAIEVVECIHYPGGRFSDPVIQAYLKGLPT